MPNVDVNIAFEKRTLQTLLNNITGIKDGKQKDQITEAITYALAMALDPYVPFDFGHDYEDEERGIKKGISAGKLRRRTEQYTKYYLNKKPDFQKAPYRKFKNMPNVTLKGGKYGKGKTAGLISRKKDVVNSIKEYSEKKAHTHLKDSVTVNGNNISYNAPYAAAVFYINKKNVDWKFQQDNGTRATYGSRGYKRGLYWLERNWENAQFKKHFYANVVNVVTLALENGVIDGGIATSRLKGDMPDRLMGSSLAVKGLSNRYNNAIKNLSKAKKSNREFKKELKKGLKG